MARKILIVCVSGSRERLQMAGMVASVAATSGNEVTIFLSMNALSYFVEGRSPRAPVEGEFGALMEADHGVPGFKQLFKYAVELGEARLLPCSMAIDLLKVSPEALDPDLGPPTGLTRLLTDAEGAQVMTF